ncbi:hypothetical protein [Thermoanaerobacterium sp. DL9XJH110]|uniref:hypothetical protein n=1 Tax=Thermoanaerobacterium sp. DL9XJH110 TaxID=3386643 RepID=UPI003BB54788
MKVSLPHLLFPQNNFTAGEVLKAAVCRKAPGGYIIQLNGKEVYAVSDLDLKIGEMLKLKVVEASGSHLTLKVIRRGAPGASGGGASVSFEMADTPETRAAIHLLSNLNLPMTEERLELLSDFFRQAGGRNKPDCPAAASHGQYHRNGAQMKNDPLNDIDSLFKIPMTRRELLEKHLTEIEKIGDFLLMKAVNGIYKKAGTEQAAFFVIPLPVYKKAYLKVFSKPSPRSGDTSISLSFLVETRNLGPALVNIVRENGLTRASITFEEKKALETARKALADPGGQASALIRSLQLKLGKISKRDFIFGEPAARGTAAGIKAGINIKV